MYKNFEMNYKNNQGYVKIYPNTTTEQVMGYNLGEVFGPYELTLNANNWEDGVLAPNQTKQLDGLRKEDYVVCTKVLNGTSEQMKQQDEAYSLLTTVISLDNYIKFGSSEIPGVDIDVQISWVR